MLTPLGGTGSRRRYTYPPAPLLITGCFLPSHYLYTSSICRSVWAGPNYRLRRRYGARSRLFVGVFARAASRPGAGSVRGSRLGRARAGSEPPAPHRPTPARWRPAQSSGRRQRRHAQKRTSSPITGRTKAPQSLLVNERNYASLGLTKLWPMRYALRGRRGRLTAEERRNIPARQLI